METEIRRLEAIARRLEPDGAQRKQWLDAVATYAGRFLDEIDAIPAYVPPGQNGRGLANTPFSETGLGIEAVLALLGEHVDSPGVNPASGRFMGYIPGGGLYHSALGDFLAAIFNRYSGYYFASPGAVQMENMLVRWMAQVIGYPETSFGSLSSGGSLAHLGGIVTARDVYQIEGERVRSAVVYLTDQAHHSIEKALRIAGLGNCIQQVIQVDGRYRMRTDVLAETIARDRQVGRQPWLLVGSAGTTNTGAIDPLLELSVIAAANEMWLHVDGAYGAFFALCEEGRQKLSGIEWSDSIVMDPHKTLFLPYGTGAILVREGRQLVNAFHGDADYLQDGIDALEEISPADVSPELTRHFRGLRLWLPLMLAGVAPFRAALAEKLLLTRYFYEKIQTVAGFEVGPPPELAVATFRYLPRRGDASAFNRQLVQALQEDGRVFLTSTRLGDKFVLRIAVGVFRTHLDEIEQAIAVLREKARELEVTV
ncbi:MAG TPA: pyridoxal-dependent decarboxylase [Anaerolineae bacterium]